jgi:hypothetical protein
VDEEINLVLRVDQVDDVDQKFLKERSGLLDEDGHGHDRVFGLLKQFTEHTHDIRPYPSSFSLRKSFPKINTHGLVFEINHVLLASDALVNRVPRLGEIVAQRVEGQFGRTVAVDHEGHGTVGDVLQEGVLAPELQLNVT